MARLRFPCIINMQRTEQGKKIRRLYKNDVGVPYRAVKCPMPRTDGMAPTITTFQEDTRIMLTTNTAQTMDYKEHPTKEDLLEYFGQRIRVRKMTPRTAFRLMDVEDSDIDKMFAYPFKTIFEKNSYLEQRKVRIAELEMFLRLKKAERKEGKWFLNNIDVTKDVLKQVNDATRELKVLRKEMSNIKGQFISKTALYRLAGNSIVCQVLYEIFRTLFIPSQSENESKQPNQPSLFDL